MHKLYKIGRAKDALHIWYRGLYSTCSCPVHNNEIICIEQVITNSSSYRFICEKNIWCAWTSLVCLAESEQFQVWKILWQTLHHCTQDTGYICSFFTKD